MNKTRNISLHNEINLIEFIEKCPGYVYFEGYYFALTPKKRDITYHSARRVGGEPARTGVFRHLIEFRRFIQKLPRTTFEFETKYNY